MKTKRFSLVKWSNGDVSNLSFKIALRNASKNQDSISSLYSLNYVIYPSTYLDLCVNKIAGKGEKKEKGKKSIKDDN